MDTLPERRGYRIAHDHEEGESCIVGRGWLDCKYTPTWVTRLRWWLAQVFG